MYARPAMEPTLTIDRIRGHRLWSVVPHPADRDPVLASMVTGDPWEGPELRASCLADHLPTPPGSPRVAAHPGARVPVLDCRCGLYAGTGRVTPPSRGIWAQGPVEMWGRVVEGTTGFRAERLRIAGDIDLVVGMGPGHPRCTRPRCRSLAVGVVTTGRSFVARCGQHGSGVDFETFESIVGDAMRRRYGVRVRLRGEVAAR